MQFNTPNILTLVRIVIIPVIILFYYLPVEKSNQIVTTLFVLAAITDWLDGYLARRWNQGSPFGEFLDPVADKLIVATALILLVSDASVLEVVYSKVLFTIVTCIIIGREITISALREWMANLGERGIVAAGMTGKVKTVLQMVAISLLLYSDTLFGLPIFRLGEIFLYIAGALTLWSMSVYLKAAWPALSRS